VKQEEVDLEEGGLRGYEYGYEPSRTSLQKRGSPSGAGTSPDTDKSGKLTTKNAKFLKANIKSTLGKHPKPNLPEEVEQMDEADVYSIKNKKTGQIYHHSKYPITKNTQKFKQIKSAGGDHVHAEIHVNGKPMKEDAEQIDEISKGTLGSYIKKASHDVAAKGAFTRHFADKSRAETAAQRPDLARLTMKKADKMQDAGMKRRANMAKAVDRLTKKD
jgi:hypothetical protein